MKVGTLHDPSTSQKSTKAPKGILVIRSREPSFKVRPSNELRIRDDLTVLLHDRHVETIAQSTQKYTSTRILNTYMKLNIDLNIRQSHTVCINNCKKKPETESVPRSSQGCVGIHMGSFPLQDLLVVLPNSSFPIFLTRPSSRTSFSKDLYFVSSKKGDIALFALFEEETSYLSSSVISMRVSNLDDFFSSPSSIE